MKQKKIAYDRALIKYPGCYLEIFYHIIDDTFPDYKNVPVNKAPAVRIWPDKDAYEKGDKEKVIAVYWLIEEF